MSSAVSSFELSLPQASPCIMEVPLKIVSDVSFPLVERNANTPELIGLKHAVDGGSSILKYFLDATSELPQGLRILAALVYRGAQEVSAKDLSAATIGKIIGVREELVGGVDAQCVSLARKGFVFQVSADTWAAAPELVAANSRHALKDCLCTFDKVALDCAEAPGASPQAVAKGLPQNIRFILSAFERAGVSTNVVQEFGTFAGQAGTLRLNVRLDTQAQAKLADKLSLEGGYEGILDSAATRFALTSLKAGDIKIAKFLSAYVDYVRKSASAAVSPMEQPPALEESEDCD